MLSAQDKVALQGAGKRAGHTVDARWFEEVRGAATERLCRASGDAARGWGYSGFGVGGAFTPHRGFVELGVNGREPWEPVAIAAAKVTR